MGRQAKYMRESDLPSDTPKHIRDQLEADLEPSSGLGLSQDPYDYLWEGDPNEPAIDVEAMLSQVASPENTLATIARAIVEANSPDEKGRGTEERVSQAVLALLGRRQPSGPKKKISDELLDKILWEYHTRDIRGGNPQWTECIAAHVPNFPKDPPNDRKQKEGTATNNKMMTRQERLTYYERVMARVKVEKNPRLLSKTQGCSEQMQERLRLMNEILSNLSKLGVPL